MGDSCRGLVCVLEGINNQKEDKHLLFSESLNGLYW
jgi:hypothetical protein